MKKHPVKHKHRRSLYLFQLMIIWSLVAGIFLMSALLLWAATIEIPDFSLFESRKIAQSTKLYDRSGKILLYDVHKDARRTIVAFDDISPYIKNATVAIEDDQFYNHRGIKPKAILRAILVNLRLREGYIGQGGSTITQQVIKNALLSQEKTITRKIKEWILAIKLERIMSKEDILMHYLNEAPYGGNIYGVEEASLSFFGVHANELTLAQAAYLAALPQAPTRFSPYGRNREGLESRKEAVLDKMRELKSITEEEYQTAIKEKVEFIPPAESGIRAPHFVMFIKEQLAEMYGDELLNEGGLRVITTIDMDLQEKGERIVKQYAEQNEKTFNATNASLVAIDPKTGQILTMVGSRDYFDVAREGNFNIALAKRQPGSAFKPFVYAAGFEKGYTPDTVLFDIATQFSTHCDAFGVPQGSATAKDCYMPGNYDGEYRGPMSIRNALAQSVNVPAVKMLYLVGVDAALEFAERLGITSLGNKAQYGLTLVLGGGEVSLLDMTSAYGVFANDGKRHPYTGILKVDDANGLTIYEYRSNETQVISPEIARNITNILADNEARAPAFGPESYLHFPNHAVAVKTGTTNDYRDAWIIGYTPSLAVGAWAGNNNNTPMEKKVAGFIVAPMWNAFFDEAFPSLPPNEQFIPPQPISQLTKPALRGLWYGGETYSVDKISGKLATEFTPQNLIEERVIPNPHEILYWVDKNDPLGAAPLNPYSDPQFLLWETPTQLWIAKHGLPREAWDAVPQSFDDLHKPSLAPRITIITPTSTVAYVSDQKLLVQTSLTSSFAITHVDFFVNGVFLGSIQNFPYDFAFTPSDIQNISDQNELRVTSYDAVGNKGETSMFFMVQNQ